ncbi:MaoC/PaaZ C-terminal domain-containing protein [Marivita sp.]|uniref:MaoC/PaaZ C-terminal domain-containing protein n=1 Tax=Marivita sp. TaxID=2003365 RepID=UPI003A88CF4F
MPEVLFFDDIEIGRIETCGTVTVDGDEMLAFAQVWDPLPIHVDPVVAEKVNGGLSAPGLYVLGLKQRLLHEAPVRAAVIASLGYEEVRFHQPVRAGDQLTLTIEWTQKRPSRSRPDRGVVEHRLSLIDPDGTVVMSHLDNILVKCRKPA